MKQFCAILYLLIFPFLFPPKAANVCRDAELMRLIEENCAWQKKLSVQTAECTSQWLSGCAQASDAQGLKRLRSIVLQHTSELRAAIFEQNHSDQDGVHALADELAELKDQCISRELVRLLEELPQSIEAKTIAVEYLRLCQGDEAFLNKYSIENLVLYLKYARFKLNKPPDFHKYIALSNDSDIRKAAIATVHKLQVLKKTGIDWLRLAFVYAEMENTLIQLDTGRKRDILGRLERIREQIDNMLSYYDSKKALSAE